jgi:hypothetical protein
MFPAEAGHACNSRLSPPGKRRVHPHWAPKTAPRRRGQFPTWPPPEGRGTAPSPDQTRRGWPTPAALTQMGVIRPARSPHPGSQTSRECTITQKDAFDCTNLVSIGTVSNGDSGLECFQWGHECKAWDLVSKMPCPTRHGQWMAPPMLKRWRYAPRGAWPVMHLQSLEKVEVPTRESAAPCLSPSKNMLLVQSLISSSLQEAILQ